MSGFEIIGLRCTLKNTIELTITIVLIIKSYPPYEEGCGNITLSLQMHVFALRRYLDALNHLAVTPQGSQDDSLAQLLHDQGAPLSILQYRLGNKISMIKSTTGSVASEPAWAIWRKRGPVSLETDLKYRVRRFHFILTSISTTRSPFQSSQPSLKRMGRSIIDVC
jgi:hypothetical protein